MKIVTSVPARDVIDEAPERNEGLYCDINAKGWWDLFDMVMAVEFPNGCTREEAVGFFNTREDYIRERLGITERTFDPEGARVFRAASLGRMAPGLG